MAHPHAARAMLGRLRQRDGLEGADDVVGAGFGKEAFIKAGAQIPIIALVIFVAIKTPDPAHHNDAADAVVPEITQIMEAKIGSGRGALKADVVVNDDLRQTQISFGRFAMLALRLSGAGMITQPPEIPLGIDDSAVCRRKFDFGYVFTHKRRIFFISTDENEHV